MRTSWLASLALAGCGGHGLNSTPQGGPCTFDAETSQSLVGGQAAIDCDPNALTLVEVELAVAFTAGLDDPNRAMTVRLALADQTGEMVLVADVVIPHNLADGTYSLGSGPTLDVYGGTAMAGSVRFSRSRDIPAFDSDDETERAYAFFVDLAVENLTWRVAESACGAGVVTVDEFTVRIEETGRVRSCDG